MKMLDKKYQQRYELLEETEQSANQSLLHVFDNCTETMFYIDVENLELFYEAYEDLLPWHIKLSTKLGNKDLIEQLNNHWKDIVDHHSILAYEEEDFIRNQ